MSTLTTDIEHCTRIPGQWKKSRKINKRHTNCKGSNKTESTVYIEFTNKKQKLNQIKKPHRTEFSKNAGYKVNIQKQIISESVNMNNLKNYRQ